jgi:hypothetical protein
MKIKARGLALGWLGAWFAVAASGTAGCGGDPGATDTDPDSDSDGDTDEDTDTSGDGGVEQVCGPPLPFPYPAGSPYAGLHGNRENNNRVACAGAESYEDAWSHLEGYLIFQPITVGADGHTVYAIAARTEGCQLYAFDSEAPGDPGLGWCAGGFTLGVSASAPEVDEDGNVYVTDGYLVDEPNGAARVVSFDSSGARRWEAPIDLAGGLSPPAEHRSPAGVHFTPGGRVVTSTVDGVVVLLSRETGAVEGAFDVPEATGFVAPAAAESTIVVPPGLATKIEGIVGPMTDEELALVVSASTGTSGAFSDNTVSVGGNGRLYLVGGGPEPEVGAMTALALDESGESPAVSFLWAVEIEGGSATSPAVTRDGTRIALGDNGGNLVYVDAEACDANADGDPDPERCAPSWTWPILGRPLLGSVAIDDDGTVFAWNASQTPTDVDLFALADGGDHGVPVFEKCFAEAGGTNRQWTSVATVLDDLVIGTLTDMISVWDSPFGVTLALETAHEIVAVDKETGEIRWRHVLPDDSINSPAIGPDGSIYLPLMGMIDLMSPSDTVTFSGGVHAFRPSAW